MHSWPSRMHLPRSTGVKISITRESNDDVQPKASVAANIGAGPDLIWGLYSLPHLFPNKCLDDH